MEQEKITLVDIGARGGLQDQWKRISSKLNVIMFEADQKECCALSKRLPHNFKVIPAAVSDASGCLPFYLCKKRAVSSAYKPNLDFLKKFNDVDRFTVEKTVKVKTDTLDHQIKLNKVPTVDFIKIDTQGHELKILKGAREVLKNTIGAELEVSFAEMYSGQSLFHDVDKFMLQHQFTLFDLSLVYWNRHAKDKYHRNKKGQLVWGDALYLRSPEDIVRSLKSTDKIVKAFTIYNLFGYFDLSSTLLDVAAETKVISRSLKADLRLKLEKDHRKSRLRRINKDLSKISYWRKGINESLGNRS